MEDCWKERRTEGGNRVHCAREKTYQHYLIDWEWALRITCLAYHYEAIPPPTVTMPPPIVTTTDDTRLADQEAKVNRLESMMR
ncbi:hypothetical protein CK203_047420 [Vitis vinifera]|uniref:Uncharacterized protein n=1 Tax=Vitis vinifera TaxID=29760 RepID=A0A438G1U8_VITVI|nr:hypothetical protein CK203_047420 [Vitis vinifera]